MMRRRRNDLQDRIRRLEERVEALEQHTHVFKGGPVRPAEELF